MSAITFKDVRFAYRRAGAEESIVVLDHVNFDVKSGEFVVLLGPSGSGKTTILHLVSTLLRPESGKVEIDGVVVSDLASRAGSHFRAENIGYVFQQANLVPTLTAYENVELPLHLFALSSAERQRRVALALNLVSLGDRAHHLPRQLSGGQEQRVAIARAIVADPPILLADEPTGNLDAESASAVLLLLQRLHRERKKTILMVTHDPRAAEFGSRSVELQKGHLVSRKDRT